MDAMTIAVQLVDNSISPRLSRKEEHMLAQCANLARDDNGDLIAYVWPGGYPLYYLDSDGSVLCPVCANNSAKTEEQIPSFLPIACDVNYEDDSLFCDDCSKQIESAYGE